MGHYRKRQKRERLIAYPYIKQKGIRYHYRKSLFGVRDTFFFSKSFGSDRKISTINSRHAINLVLKNFFS